MMQTRTRGTNNLTVSALGLGCMVLTPEDLRDIDTAASKIAIKGARYPEHLEKRTGI